MKLPQSGGCQCGKVRYQISEEPHPVYTCHCLDCQRLTSSAFSLGVVVPERGFRLTGLEPRQFQRTADSGRVTMSDWSARSAAPGFAACREMVWSVSGADAGRYILAAAHEAYMDSQEAALDPAPRARRSLRGPACGIGRGRSPWQECAQRADSDFGASCSAPRGCRSGPFYGRDGSE